jgi:hypothetical protein
LIDADLMLAETIARMCVEKKTWRVSDRRLASEAWQQYRDAIASHVQCNDWIAVIVAVEVVGDLQGSRGAARKIQLAEIATNPETRDALAAAQVNDLDITDPAPDLPEGTVAQLTPMLAGPAAGRRAQASLTQRAPKHR